MDPAILEPVPGANPSGSNAVYDRAYNQLYERVRRARGEPVPGPQDEGIHNPVEDWRFVEGTCLEILRERSKDLRIAAWLAESQFALHGVTGLANGLATLSDLTDTFWDTLYPEMEDGDSEARERVFMALGARLAAAARKEDACGESTGSATGDALSRRVHELDDCFTALEKLEEVCQVRFGQGVPVLSEFRQALFESRVRARKVWIRWKMAENSQKAQAFLSRNAALAKLEMDESAVGSLGPVEGTSNESTNKGRSAQEVESLDSGLTGSASSSSGTSSVAPESTKVDFTLTAPAVIAPQVPFELFVWAHVPEERSRVLARAREQLGTKDILDRTKGPFRIPEGTAITARLRIMGAVIEEPEDTMVWDGESTCVSFIVTLPEISPNTRCAGTAEIYTGGIQIARIPFLLSSGGLSGGMNTASGIRHRSAFASYASDDRDAVLGRIQGIQKVAPDLDVFLDVMSLRSGQNWEQELWRVIPASDVFYLFWSAHARKSDWVEKEWRCALRERGIGFIDPIPLESPQDSPPPPELSSLHFNDWVLAFRRSNPAAPPTPS